ncbi:hypothetical protein CDAR_199121 [Caerostris darwini]|uniref:Uncharacterized protein n=1 Tax=Caerostris darwini TaxID=1538125 RepID=A0AAV4VFM0_9ARAC|nr:hypothetical protein CDAR_199121 [Caerostris darwini]
MRRTFEPRIMSSQPESIPSDAFVSKGLNLLQPVGNATPIPLNQLYGRYLRVAQNPRRSFELNPALCPLRFPIESRAPAANSRWQCGNPQFHPQPNSAPFSPTPLSTHLCRCYALRPPRPLVSMEGFYFTPPSLQETSRNRKRRRERQINMRQDSIQNCNGGVAIPQVSSA